MSKKGKIILGSVVAVCCFGCFSSLFIDWPVDFSDADGDIAKATRFSREQASEKLTNMEELLQTDSAFKDGIVTAQYVMQTRALQFGSLVDMSNEVAGEIPAFADVLKDMNAAREMVSNVTNSLMESGQNLDAALSGEECADLEQTTINASLAYTTLQKQNKLATRFIETTDKYLETAQGDDHLKFVRDQWVDYQKMTAALDGDKAAAEALAKKGNLLSGEKTLAAIGDFGIAQQVSMVNSAFMTKYSGIDGSLVKALPGEALEGVVTKIRSAAEVYSNQAGAMKNQAGAMKNQADAMKNQAGAMKNQAGAMKNQVDAMKNQAGAMKNQVDAMSSQQVAKFNQSVIDAMNEAVIVANNRQIVANNRETVVSSQPTMVSQKQKIVSQQATVGQIPTLEMKKGGGPVVFGQTVNIVSSTSHVMEAYTNVMRSVQKVSSTQHGLFNQIGEAIKNTAVGNRAELKIYAGQ